MRPFRTSPGLLLGLFHQIEDEPRAWAARTGGSVVELHLYEAPQLRGLDAYERALWNWVNVYDLDVFLQDVYRYYEGKGIYSIALSRALHLL